MCARPFWLLCLLLVGCAYPRPPQGGGANPLAHSFRLIGLSADGRSLVEEKEALSPPGGTVVRYHLSTPEGGVTEVEERPCEGGCEGQAPSLDALQLEPPGRFLLVEGPLPLRHTVPVPEVGALNLVLDVSRVRYGTWGPQLRLRQRSASELALWQLPKARAVAARHYLAGEWLFTEVELEGLPSVVVRPVRLPKAAAALMELDASVAMAQGRFDTAYAQTRTGLLLDEGSGSLHFRLALLQVQRGELEAAVASVRRACELEPRFFPGAARAEKGFDPLRGREDFDALIAPLGRQAPP